MTELLSIPFKSSVDADIAKPLKTLISSKYTGEDQTDHSEAVAEFQKLRQTAAVRPLEKTESCLETIGKYYDQIVALEHKIPSREVQVAFKWKDAFDKGSIFGGRLSLTVPSLAYEKVCILFNLAAMNSAIAAAQNVHSEDGLQKANKKFQVAAGIFTHLKQRVRSDVAQEPTPDLEPEALGVLSTICLAQAQEMVVLKAIHDRMKDNIIAKLSAHADDLYADVLKAMQKESVRNLWDKDWLPIVSGKQALYNGLSQYHQSKVCNANKVIGEEIGRLQYATELLAACASRSGRNLANCEDWSKRIANALKEAMKDNDFIYHERIIKTDQLPAIGRAVVVKPTPLPEKFVPNGGDLFDKLMPAHIHHAITMYDARKQEIVGKEMGRLKEASSFLNDILSSMNLPAGLEDTSGGGVPASIVEKSAAVIGNGGVATLENFMKELPDLLQRNTDILNESERMLRDERESDDKLKTQYKDKWNRTPSSNLTSGFTSNAGKYRTIIENAKQADGKVREKYGAHVGWMRSLEGGESGMMSVLPAGAGGGGGPATTQLKQLMEQVDTIRAERQVIESELKTANPDMLSVFTSAAASGQLDEQAISQDSLGRVFGPLQAQTQESIERQERLIAQIQELHQQFIVEKGGAGDAREEALKAVAASFDVYMELNANLKEGTKFYNDLTQLLVTFQNKVSDFCFARRTEKEDLMKDLTASLAAMGVSATPNIPAHHVQEPMARPADSTDAPQQPASSSAPPNPYAGAPGPLPYPQQNQFPMPFQSFTPMPTGYNPYNPYPPQQPYPAMPGYPAPPGYPGYPPQQGGTGYPSQQGGYPAYPPPRQ